MSNILKQIYKMVLNEEFTYGSFDKRLKLQKTVYLLESIGVHIGNYGFTWYKHGPYSQELQDDAFCSSEDDLDIKLSQDAIKKINKIKKYVSEYTSTNYSEAYWLEDIASLYYLKYRRKVQQKDLLNTLQSLKSHLSDANSNLRALRIIDEIHKMVA